MIMINQLPSNDQCRWWPVDSVWPCVRFDCHGQIGGTHPGAEFKFCPYCGKEIKWLQLPYDPDARHTPETIEPTVELVAWLTTEAERWHKDARSSAGAFEAGYAEALDDVLTRLTTEVKAKDKVDPP